MANSKQRSPFTFLTSINDTKADLSQDSDGMAGYVPFVVNRSLSYFNDTVLLANELNQRHHLDHNAQYLFLLNTVRKRKRFSKWIKPTVESDIEAIQEYYGYNMQRAKDALALLSPEQIITIRQRVNKGGRK